MISILSDILSQSKVLCLIKVQSQKKLFELIADTLANEGSNLSSYDIFDGLFAREKLGSTTIGHGVAIPHARLEGLTEVTGCFISLSEGIDCQAEDNQLIDLIFTLLVPNEIEHEHAQLLQHVVQKLGQLSVRQRLRQCQSNDELYQTLLEVI